MSFEEPAPPQRPLLVVQHEDQCSAGWVGEWLTDASIALDLRRPYAGEPLPDDLTDHAGLLVLGGHMGANDDADYPWLTGTKALVRTAAAVGIPTLGICLGHQLVAAALGGEVVVNPAGQQFGLHDIGWLAAAAGDPILGDCGSRGVHLNHDIVAVSPPGTLELARAATGELQAARFAPTVWGVQWHPEVGVEAYTPWAEHDRAEATARGIDVDQELADIAAAEPELRRSWRPLATDFALLVLES
ncbi:MAG: type 1 glutamine amidotransferase [Lapillicoccus sp.]